MPNLIVSSFCKSLLLITYLNYPTFIYYSNWITTSFFNLLHLIPGLAQTNFLPNTMILRTQSGLSNLPL